MNTSHLKGRHVLEDAYIPRPKVEIRIRITKTQIFIILFMLLALIVWEVFIWGEGVEAKIFPIIVFLWGLLLTIGLANSSTRFAGIYLLSFGLFLLPRELIDIVNGWRLSDFPARVTVITYGILLTALVGLLAGFGCYLFLSRISRRSPFFNKGVPLGRTVLVPQTHFLRKNIYAVFVGVFILVLAASILSRLFAVAYVLQNGYGALFAQYFELRSTNLLLYLLWKVELALPLCFALVLGFRPKGKKAPFLLIACYSLYLFCNIFSGQRFATVSGLIVVLFYLIRCYGNVIILFVKKRKVLSFISVFTCLSAGIAILSGMERLRNTEDGTFQNVFANFFYTQGVTLLTVKRTVYFADLLPIGKHYSLSVFDYGLFAILRGVETYQGNSPTTALMGSSLSQALSYTVAPTMYLKGYSLGSSYLAESYHDFGFLGVLLWSLLFGIICIWIGSASTTRLGESLRYLIIPSILWTPRGESSGFIQAIVQPSNFLVVVMIGLFLMAGYWFGLFSLAKRPRKISLSTRRRQGEHVSS